MVTGDREKGSSTAGSTREGICVGVSSAGAGGLRGIPLCLTAATATTGGHEHLDLLVTRSEL